MTKNVAILYANELINQCFEETKYINIDKICIDIILELSLMNEEFSEKFSEKIGENKKEFAEEFVENYLDIFNQILIINIYLKNDKLESIILELLVSFLMDNGI